LLSFLHYNNWSRLNKSSSDPILDLSLKRNVLFSRFCILAAIGAGIQAVSDYSDGFPYIALIDCGFVAFLLIGFLLNERKYHITSKIFLFSLANISLFAFASVVPKGMGVYLLFYPLVVFVVIAFEYKEKMYTYFFFTLALILNLVLVATKFQPFGPINLQPSDPTISFVLNLIISFVMISVGINFLQSLNLKAENKLVENQQKTSQLANALKKKNEDLEKTNKELDQFVYSVSHDLRAPLASVAGILNLIKLESIDLPKIIENYNKLMEDRVQGLDGFIQDILDYSRNARTGVNLMEVNIKELIQEVIDHNAYLKKANKIKTNVLIEVEQLLKLDRTRMFSVLNNLVSNAVKYNDIAKPNPFIKIAVSLADKNLIFTIKDSGEGICDACKDQVFDMFYRGTQSSTGSGLGLYITKEMVEKMGGAISFTSEEGVGSEFEFSVPV